MKDYEQLYYDILYETKKLRRENIILKQEIDLYKNLIKNKDLKKYIVKEIIRYKNGENYDIYR
jgi:hypothetical protein